MLPSCNFVEKHEEALLRKVTFRNQASDLRTIGVKLDASIVQSNRNA